MNFLHPAAFAGLASLLVLILLSLWRQRPATGIVPSVRLWERIPDRLPPVRALRRPRASLSLLLQMVVATALVVALAGPGIVRHQPAPRRITVVVDSSAYMAPRTNDVGRELSKLDSSDEIHTIETGSLRRSEGRHGYHELSMASVVDPGPALDLAASEATEIVYVSDRRPSWSPPPGVSLHLVLVGGPLDNTGIVDAGVEDGKLFLRLSRSAEVEVAIGNAATKRPPAIFHLIEVPAGATRITASLAPDAFTADDRVEVERSEGRVDVGFSGRPDASILAAIESNPAARVVRGGAPRLLIRIGEGRGGASAPVVVDADPREGVATWSAPGEISVAPHELTEKVEAEDMKLTEVGTLGEPAETPLMFSGGKPFAALLKRGEIVIAAKYASAGWPARPSFPIFWANVLRYAASGAGAWSAKGLLDEAASRPGLERMALDPGKFQARPLATLRTDLSGASIALAALLLAVLWFFESRSRE